MPFWFLSQALPVLLRQQGMSLEAIGLLPLVAIAIAFKFLWSPLIDRYSYARWGHYRFWIILFQLLVVAITVVCSLLNLETQLPFILLGLAIMGTCCASQDIATDALAVRLLEPYERGMGNAVQGIGGALGRMIGGGGMLILLNRWGWTNSLLSLAAVMVIALVPVLIYREPHRKISETNTVFGQQNYFKVFIKFVQRPGMGTWLLVLGLYAATHNLSATMFTPLLVDAGLSMADIGSLQGVFGISVSILGTLAAGILIGKLGRKGTLLVAGAISLTGILFYQLPTFGFTQLPVLYSIVSFAFFSLGMVGTTAFTIMMDKSRPEMAGTDYTLQTSLIAIGSVLSAAVSGVLAEAIGYRGVFALSGVLGMVCLAVIAKKLTLSTHSVSRDEQIKSQLEKSV
ncbi:arabinose efflux permease family protein [Leptolyngbya sp. Heron Island J]|nr:arabinose efflux permease family protein [Leptolyngbya sp. Heron Island J]